MPKKELIVLDVVEHDTVAALEYLLTLCAKNKVAGLIFGVALKNERTHAHLCGATGRLATDLVEAAGVGSMLHMKLTKQAVERNLNDK